MMNHHRKPAVFEWAKLNADGLFVALLMIGAGAFDFFLWRENPIILHGNHAEQYLVQGRALGYVLAGLLLLYSLIAGKIHQEVIARFMFLGAVLFQIWRRWLEFDGMLGGLTATPVLQVVILFIIYAVTSWLRMRVLLAKEGVTFTIPPRKEE